MTGGGLCCNLGDEAADAKAFLRAGRRGIFEVHPEAVELQCRCQVYAPYQGDVSDGALEIKKSLGRFMGRASRMAYRAATRALNQAGLSRRDIGVIVGSGTGDVAAHLEMSSKLARLKDAKRMVPTFIPRLMSSTVSANLVNVLETTGPSFSVSAACAGGAYNIVMASELIERGHIDAAIAGGVEVYDPHFYVGFDAMRAYNGEDNHRPDEASRPYAADRAGFVFGEGAGVVVLETREHAEARGAEILAVLRGYGMSSNGDGEMVAPSQDGARRAMENALRHASVSAREIDYVNTHGTSTPLGDAAEFEALHAVFGPELPAFSSTKGYTGHTISAAGTLEAIFISWMLAEGFVAPSINADLLDPRFADAPPVREPMSRPLSRCMSNSFGFGGTNVSLVLEHPGLARSP